MSESSFPFEGQPGPNALDQLEPEAGGGNRTALLAVGGVAATLVLGAAAYFFVFAGGGEDTAGSEAAGPQPVVVDPAPVETTAPVKKERLSAKSFGRDPYRALISEPVVAAVDPSAGAVPVVTAPAVSVVPVGSGAAPAATGTSSPSTSVPHTFRVVEVAPDNGDITVKVDGKTYKNLKAGEVFGTYFKVVLISGQVNSFQFGEEKFNVVGTKRLTIA